MAAAPLPGAPLPLLLLLLLPLPCGAGSGPAPDRRFAELKRCADPECSMLMCRGKATQDFKGPDCRFVNFKKGEAVYVYYKLIRKSIELWAGSVGSDFGYFPKDLLEIKHNYTDDELELPTDETDFVCFDGGKDDFDNYNVAELLKLSEEIVANGGESDLNAAGKEVFEQITREEETEEVDTETDVFELSTEERKEREEEDSSLSKMTENVERDLESQRDTLIVNSNEENSQGDQMAHEHLKGILQEQSEGLESENTKNSSIPQEEAKQSEKESEEIDAYTLLNRELSMNLKTKFGSTADALVSDDEMTSLVTSLEDDFNEDTQDTENLEDHKDHSEEIPLLSFVEEEETDSPLDSEAEIHLVDKNADLNSEEVEPDEAPEDATELINQRDYGKKDDSDLLTSVEDTIFSIVTGNEKRNDNTEVNKSDTAEEKEEEDEVIHISKEKKQAVKSKLRDLTEEGLIEKEGHPVDDLDLKEKTNKSKQYEEFSLDGGSEELQNTFENGPDQEVDLESKQPTEKNQNVLKPPLSESKEDSEEMTLHKIMKETEKPREILEDSLENETKHKTLWKNMKERKAAVGKQSVNVLHKPLEELQNVSQSDLENTDLLEGKEQETSPTQAQVVQKDEKDLEQVRVPETETHVFREEEVAIPREKVKKIPTEKKDLSNWHEREAAVKQARQQENETRHTEEGVEQELSQNADQTLPDKPPGESPAEDLSMNTEQEVNADSSDQQDTADNEDQNLDKALGTDLTREKTLKPELESEELEVEEDYDPKQMEDELLEDENAASAKLSKERFASGHGSKLNMKRTNPELEIPTEAISGTANPVYENDEIGEEVNITSEQAGKKSSMQDVTKIKNEETDMQIKKASQLNNMEDDKDDKVTLESFEVENEDGITFSNDASSPEMVDSKDVFNQRENPLQQDHLWKNMKDVENLTDQEINDHQQSSHLHGSADISGTTNEVMKPEHRDSVKQLMIMKDFFDEKRVARLKKYLGPQHIVRIEAMFHDMKLELELAQKGNNNHETIEKTLDQILESSESSIMDVVENVLDSRVTENKEEVVKEMDLYDEETAVMDDIQELIYSLRHKYSAVFDSAPLASTADPGMDSRLHVADTAKEIQYDRHPTGSPNMAEESDQTFPQLEDRRPLQSPEGEEETLKPKNPEHDINIVKQASILEKKEVYQSEKGMQLTDTSLESSSLGQSDTEDFSAGTVPGAEEKRPPSETQPVAPSLLATLSDAIVGAKDNMRPVMEMLVAALPEDFRPGPDFHGLPWEPIVITTLVGIATLVVVFWRTCLSVKSRIYQVTEKQLVEKIKNLLQEKTEILEKMSEYDQKINEAKESVKVVQQQNTSLSHEAAGLKDTIKELEETNHLLDDKMGNLNKMLETEKQQNLKKQDKILEMQKSLEKLQEVITLHSVELTEVQVALNEAKLSEEKVKSELCHVQEENGRLKKRKEQLLQEAEGWSERHAELSEQIKLYQKSQKDIEEALAYKENEIEVLTNCIMQLKQLDMDSESEAKKGGEGNGWDAGDDLANGELPDNRGEKMKNQIKQMMDVSRVRTMLSIVEEDRNLLQSKLSDEITARHELEEQIKKLEHDSCSLQTAKSRLENDCKTLQQKVEILNELYQQKEMALQKKLTQEEYERQEKEQKLSAADEKAVLAVEEVKVYKQRIQEMEEELQKTERSYKNQIATHEKKAHDNWLIARSAERALAEEKREAANLRQKLIEVNEKIAMLQRPLIVKPTPGRPDRQVPPRRGPLSRDGSFGPSPVSGGAPSPPMIEVPVRPLSASRREGPRGEFGTMVDGPPAPRRPPELSGRMSAPDLGPAVAALISSGPRTSSPSTALDGAANPGLKGPPSFSGIGNSPIMNSPVTGPLPPPVKFGPPPSLRGHYGPRPLPLPLVRGPLPPPPASRDYIPGPPGMRELPPGPLPPPDPRGYIRGPPPFRPLGPLGPRDYPPGPRLPLHPHGPRDYPPLPPNRDLPPAGPRDYPPGSLRPPSPAGSRDYTQPPEQKP
ncbi:PREDICTED: melanoma inhibitory activity protein 3 isoform X2 [Crocodylus porosus]|uniref:Transport and Golgi organization protein 1 homolog n=1 Tax=Crocodylus porosus TaxID=8502 RepID=A0A7M4E343_CROPO|nr:PREDICTED: melanoma inhibitory activity protein 3 isoform X2 [Crocodylus porosus]